MTEASTETIQARVAALLQTIDISYKPSGAKPRYSGYHRAAAVLSTFEPKTLRPTDKSGRKSLKALLEDCAPVGREAPQRYTLRPDVRRKVLKQIGTRAGMKQALAANPDRPSDSDQTMLEAYICGDAPSLEKQKAQDLTGTFQVVQWLEGILDGLPALEAVRWRWEEVDLLRPFNMLAGDKFRGREQELESLRSYVFDPAPVLSAEAAANSAALYNGPGLASLADGGKPPLVFWGPGGVGKSALISRFIEKLADRPAGEQIAWAYIDFDRPGLDPAEPLTLLVEWVRQLAVQYPGRRQNCNRFSQYLQEMLVDSVKRGQEAQRPTVKQANIGKGTRTPDLYSYLRDLASLLELLARPEASLAEDGSLAELGVDERLKQRESQEQQTMAPDEAPGRAAPAAPPFLVVLDTFEEVQFRSQAMVDRLFDFLAALRGWVPQVRPVLAGRNEVHSRWTEVDNRKLGNFQPEAAQALLEADGVPPDLAGHIVEQVGGSPLSLRLALNLWHRGLADEGLAGLKPDQAADEEAELEFEILESQMQGVLFARILEHIHDDDVRQLAHPGLVLRRVTPELIQEVLAKPCHLRVRDLAHAEELFDCLAQEEALVTVDGRALRHRPDVRPIMVRLLRDTNPVQVRAIEKAAVRYYSQRKSPEDRAEEIYHRLSLEQSLDLVSRRWADAEKRGWTQQIRALLFGARDELEPRERAWLAAKLDVELTPEEAEEADQASWEKQTVQAVQRYLEYDQPQAALEKLAQPRKWLPGSALYLLAAQAHEQVGQDDKARELLQRGYRSAAQKGDRALALELRLQVVRLDLKQADYKAAAKQLDSAQNLVQGGTRSAMSLLEIDLYRRAVARAAGDDKAAESAMASLLDRAADIPDEKLAYDPPLAAWLAAEVGAERTPIMVRVLRLIRLWKGSADAVEPLVVALAGWDVARSAQQGEPAGALARRIGIQPEPDSKPSQTWRAYFRQAKPDDSGQALAKLLEDEPEVPAEVLNALASVMRQRAGERVIGGQAIPPGDKGRTEPSTGPSAVLPEAERPGQEPSPELPPVARGDKPKDGQPSGRIKLTGQQFKAFHEALVSAFNLQELDMMVTLRLNRRLETITAGRSLDATMFELIDQAEKEGWSLKLLDAARNARPDNPDLAALADQLGLGLAGEQGLLEKQIVEVTGSLLDERTWRSRLARLETQVCRVEVGGRTFGTGFLVGPSTVLTAYHVVEEVIRSLVPPKDVGLRFDYRASPDGATVNEGKVFTLEPDWLLDYSPHSSADIDPQRGGAGPAPDELAYALLQVADQPGYSGVGSVGLESYAELRGWVKLPASPPELKTGDPLFVLHHPLGQPLKLAWSAEAIVDVSANGTRVQYRLNTEPGSAGAPCFDGNWNLCVLHLGSRPPANLGQPGVCFGTPIHAILDLLSRRGRMGWFGGQAR